VEEEASKSPTIDVHQAQDVNSSLSSKFLEINDFGQITKLSEDIDFSKPPPAFDSSIDHAPKRKHNLTDAEKNLALSNALKYFHKDLHHIVKPALQKEFDTYGHIYCYHLLPSSPLKAIPYEHITGRFTRLCLCMQKSVNNMCVMFRKVTRVSRYDSHDSQ
jgi:urocanate hydratase